MVMEAALEPVRRARQRGVDIALADAELADQVGADMVVQHRRAGRSAASGSTTAGSGSRSTVDQLGGVFGQIAALGHDDRDRLADMPHLVVGEQRLLRIEEFVLDLRWSICSAARIACPAPAAGAATSSAPLST